MYNNTKKLNYKKYSSQKNISPGAITAAPATGCKNNKKPFQEIRPTIPPPNPHLFSGSFRPNPMSLAYNLLSRSLDRLFSNTPPRLATLDPPRQQNRLELTPPIRAGQHRTIFLLNNIFKFSSNALIATSQRQNFKICPRLTE